MIAKAHLVSALLEHHHCSHIAIRLVRVVYSERSHVYTLDYLILGINSEHSSAICGHTQIPQTGIL